MKITFAVRVSTDQYWDNDRVEREISVSADTDEVLVASALAALPFLKKLTQQAIQERITSRDASEALAALDAALEATKTQGDTEQQHVTAQMKMLAQQEDTDESNTDEG